MLIHYVSKTKWIQYACAKIFFLMCKNELTKPDNQSGYSGTTEVLGHVLILKMVNAKAVIIFTIVH